MQLRPGDLFVDAFGEWEVVGAPEAMRGGKIERVWVQHPDEPADEARDRRAGVREDRGATEEGETMTVPTYVTGISDPISSRLRPFGTAIGPVRAEPAIRPRSRRSTRCSLAPS